MGKKETKKVKRGQPIADKIVGGVNTLADWIAPTLNVLARGIARLIIVAGALLYAQTWFVGRVFDETLAWIAGAVATAAVVYVATLKVDGRK